MEDAETTVRSVAHFIEGRDHAVKMLIRAADLKATGEASIRNDERAPHQGQRNFVRSYLESIIEDRDLLEGFAAVLSDVLGHSSGAEVSRFEDLKLGDIVHTPAARG